MSLRLKSNPTLSTVLEVEEILRKEARRGSAFPLSVSEIERRMKAKRTRRETVTTAIQALEHYGVAAVTSQGVVYTRVASRRLSRPVEELA